MTNSKEFAVFFEDEIQFFLREHELLRLKSQDK